MRYHGIYDVLHKFPFEPFRIQLTNGQSYVIEHPDFAWVTRSSVLVGMPSGDDEVPDRFRQYDLLHVLGIEPVKRNGRSGGKQRKKRPGR